MIRSANKLKHLNWAIQYLHEAETGFRDVIWTDECTVQVKSHRQFCRRKVGEPPRNKLRYYFRLIPNSSNNLYIFVLEYRILFKIRIYFVR